MEKPIISLKNINYSYFTGGIEYQALTNINLEVKKGEYVAILGASGSGKSTLMNILGTLSKSTSGKMFLKDIDVTSLSESELSAFRNKELGFIFQQFHLLPRLSVLQNVLLGSQYVDQHIDKSHLQDLDFKEKAISLLKRLGIGDQIDKLPVNLSGGQKQRVAIARSLLLNPSLLLADEPTGALDSKSTAEVLAILDQLHADGNTLIVITHDPTVAARASRQIKISDGQIVFDSGSPQNLNLNEKFGIATETPTLIKKSKSFFDLLGSWVVSFQQVWRSMMSAKLRTGLTALGLVIGVMSIVITFTLSEAAKDVILKIFDRSGADKVYVGYDYQTARAKGLGFWKGLHLKTQLKDLEKKMEPYGIVVPMYESWGQKPLKIAGQSATVQIETVKSAAEFNSQGLSIAKGRFFQPIEIEGATNVTLIGEKFAEKYFPENYEGRWKNLNFPIGEKFYLGGSINRTVTVIGVLNHKDAMFERNPNEVVYLPLASLINAASAPYATWFSIIPKSKEMSRPAGEAMANVLKMTSSARLPFVIEVPEESIGKIMSFILIFQTLTLLVGGLCIIVGGIGIMNIMLVTIAERIKEIGLIKALGATPKNVRNQFLQECSTLCLISGGAAVVISVIFCNLVVIIAHQFLPNLIEVKPLINVFAISLGLFTSVFSGFVFGMLPAAKAAKLEPSEALRSE